MRMPQRPPDLQSLYREVGGRLEAILGLTDPSHRGQYLHWDKLRRLKPPAGLNHHEWWLALKMARLGQRTQIPLQATDGRQFGFLLPEPLPERLHEIDLSAGGSIEVSDQVTNPSTRDRYIVNSLIDEAITSSQLEGAVTTREIAEDMIRTGREPRDQSEQMIVNNYQTMRFIRTVTDQTLTPALVCDIQRRVTSDTLDDPSAAGRPRRSGERVDIADEYGEVFHVPPPANELEHRIEAMCDFANARTPRDSFVHPVIRSMILHFWLAYDHPFKDGNGRTARALFYWSMLRHGYWLCEFISISHMIRNAPTKYYRAFLHTETDDNDLTYFLVYHVGIIRQAIDELHGYVRKKTLELRSLEQSLRGLEYLNHRQRALINHALRHPNGRYTIESHRNSHDVVYETARTDLRNLVDRGLLESRKSGKTWMFFPTSDLAERLRG